MNRSITILFLLFMLLITGAFASMAQNNYGFTLIGSVAVCFALFFLYHLVRKFRKSRNPSSQSVLELGGLSILAIASALNIFHVRVPFLSYVSAIAAVLLIGVYGWSLRKTLVSGKGNAWIILYYLGILVFLFSFALSPFFPGITLFADSLGFICLLLFVLGVLLWPMISKGWSQNRILDVIGGFRDRSFLVASLFFVMALYGFAVRGGALPPLYADTYPKVFFDMTGTGERVKGDERNATSPAEFKSSYERFVSRNLEQPH